jgi:hypothetical protein
MQAAEAAATKNPLAMGHFVFKAHCCKPDPNIRGINMAVPYKAAMFFCGIIFTFSSIGNIHRKWAYNELCLSFY